MDELLCKHVKCKFKHCDKNLYCIKHQIYVFVDETKKLNKKTCSQYIRGCRAQLDITYKFSSCKDCLLKKRKQDSDRRKESKVIICDEGSASCTTCCVVQLLDQFVGEKVNTQTKTCKLCRERNKIQGDKRDKTHRNKLARVAEQKPERKDNKKEWASKNHDKVIMKCLNYRQRQMENNLPEYRKRNAENQKKWRTENQCADTYNLFRSSNASYSYTNYKRSAQLRNLSFTISDTVFKDIVKKPCFYCDEIQDKGFNGIDRLAHDTGYEVKNCVSCCQICNFMKSCLNHVVFIKQIEHILTYNNKANGELNYNLFEDYNGCAYSIYKRRAKKRELVFIITEPEFVKMIQSPCYLCGKCNSSSHTNGVDRIDNLVGYTTENTAPCCGECNYMKRDYSIATIFDKFVKIYNNHNSIQINDEDFVNGTKHIVKGNKKSKAECVEYTKSRKDEKTQDLLSRYNDDEWKNEKVKQLMELRMMSKNDTRTA